MRRHSAANRQLFGDLEAEAIQAHDLFRIVRQDTNGVKTEVHEDLRADAVFAEIGLEPKPLVRLDGVQSFLLLQLVGVNLVREANATPLLPQIDDHAAAFLGDHLHRPPQLVAAIAPLRAEHIAGEALAMHAHQHIALACDVALHKRDVMLTVHHRAVEIQREIAKLRRQ